MSTLVWRRLAETAARAASACRDLPPTCLITRSGDPVLRDLELRLLVLKHVRQWSFDELQWEVTGNVAYRAFCRIDSGKVPDAKTMVRINQAIDEATLRRVFERVVEWPKPPPWEPWYSVRAWSRRVLQPDFCTGM